MNYLSRAVTSAVRNKQKTLLLFFLTLFIGILMAGTFLVNRASVRTIDNVIDTMRPQGMIGIDVREWHNALFNLTDFGVGSDDIGAVFSPRLDSRFIQEMGVSPYVVGYDYFYEKYLFSTEIGMYVAEYDGAYIGASRRYGLGYRFLIRGVSSPGFIEIEQGIIEITLGRTFAEEEFTGAYPVAIISEALALENQVSIGCIMPFYSVVLNPKEVFCMGCLNDENTLGTLFYGIEVIGIFSISPNVTSQDIDARWANVSLLDNLSNRIYVPGVFLEQVDRETRQLAEYWDFKTLLSQVVYEPRDGPLVGHYKMASLFYAMDVVSLFQLRSSHDEIHFAEKMEPLLPNLHKIEFVSNDYRTIVNALELMTSTTNTLLYFMIGAMVFILSLLIILFMRDRKQEIGIYFSMGEKKIKVAMQMVVEVLAITIPALVIALVVGNIFGNQIAEHLLINDLLAEIESGGEELGWSLFFMLGLGAEQMSISTLLANYDNALTIGRVLVFLGIGIGTILLATVAPLLFVFRMSPKKILIT